MALSNSVSSESISSIFIKYIQPSDSIEYLFSSDSNNNHLRLCLVAIGQQINGDSTYIQLEVQLLLS